jgi:hypothetical protein
MFLLDGYQLVIEVSSHMHLTGVTSLARQRALALLVIGAIPLELLLVGRVAARAGHAEVLFAAAAIDCVILCGGALWWLGRSGVRVAKARYLRLAAIAMALFALACRVAGLPLPRALWALTALGDLALVVLVAFGVKRATTLLPAPVVAVAETELSMVRAAARALTRRPLPSDASLHTTSRSSELGRLYAALGLVVALELPAAHVLVHAFAPGRIGVHLVLAVLDVYGVLWMIGDWRRLRETGHRMGTHTLELHLGLRARATVPRAQITSVRRLDGARRRRGDLTPYEAPNVEIELREPVEVRGPFGLRRRSAQLRLRVDDPDRFLAAF